MAGGRRWGALAFAMLCTASAPHDEKAACDRACLSDLLDRYLAAFISHQPQRAPFGTGLKITENGAPIRVGGGAWQTVSGLGTYRMRAFDPVTGQAAYIGVLKEAGKSTMFALRLKVDDRQIGEVETVIARVGLPGKEGQAAETLKSARPGFSETVPPRDRGSRAEMLAAADSYYRGIELGTGKVVAFADDCHRIENGVPLVNNPDYHFDVVSPTGRELPNFAAMGCRQQFDTGFWSTDSVADKRFPVVDTERGVVVAFTRYRGHAKGNCANVKGVGAVCPSHPTGRYDLDLVEWFHVRSGKIHEMESVWTVLPQHQGVGW
ncbi:MAG: hypothetical protein J7498_12455 [Sphingobium sp.]|nr:hypothetical protein [Sphingobium sp.]